MLFILFELGADRYALEAGRVAEVLPLVAIKQIPQAPAGVAGIIDYRGMPVPVIDLSEMALGRPAQRHLSTRIIVAQYADGTTSGHLLGLIAERATATMRCDAEDFKTSGISDDAAPYLGPVVSDQRGLVQWIEVDRLLSPSVRAVLFRQTLEQT